MNQSNILLFESKWKSFLKESTNSVVDDYGIDDLLNSMGFSDEDEKEQNDNETLENNVELITSRLLYTFTKKSLKELYFKGALDNTPLKTIPLQKFLGAGSYAVAFEDDAGHVIKCGEFRTENATDKAFLQKYLKKPNKSFVVHYLKTFPGSQGAELFIAITNKFLTFYEYAQFIIASKNNERTYTKDRMGYPGELQNLCSEIDNIRGDLMHASSSIKLTFPIIYKALVEKEPWVIKGFYNGLAMDWKLGSKDAYKILTEIIKIYCTQAKPDISLNNLGVNITAGMNNPSFFFFDV